MTTISTTLLEHARRAPDKIAVWCDGQETSYAALADVAHKWACAMFAQGVRRGDHIGVLLPNNVEFVALMFAAAELGATLVPLSISLPLPAIQRAFHASDVRHVVACASTLEDLIGLKQGELAFITGMWLAIDAEVPGAAFLPRLLTETLPLPSFDAQDGDSFVLTMTSGSTGSPKPIVLTQKNKLIRAHAAIQLYGITSDDKVLAATPLYHSLAERLTLVPLLSGATLVLMSRFSPSEWLRTVNEQAVSFTIAVSSQLGQIAKLFEKEETIAIQSLRCVVSSSALLNADVKFVLLNKLRCEFHECYGASEIAIASNLDPCGAKERLDSVGKAAPSVDIRILGTGDVPAATGEVGEIVCKTPMLFGGYYKLPEMTRAAMWGDYFRTGDLGKVDGDGFLTFCGRKKDLIVTGGINVYPVDIESVLLRLPSVAECAAFPLADEGLGEIVAVAVVPADTHAFSQREARRHCAEALADFQQPRKYFIVESLPKNGMGKIMKQTLINEMTGK